jgi:hypothetical protein
MAFYTDIRDDVVAPLITKYGLSATLRSIATSYDPTTGVGTNTDTDTAIKLVKLPIERPKLRNFFREELIERASYQFLVSAKELNSASVVPRSNDKVVLSGQVFAILGVNEVAPGDTVVLYKLLVEG